MLEFCFIIAAFIFSCVRSFAFKFRSLTTGLSDIALTAMVILSVSVPLSIRLMRRGSPNLTCCLRNTERAMSRAVRPVGSLSLSFSFSSDSSVSDEIVLEVIDIFEERLL